ncbi:hypothetical protein [Streptosporangium carneum]|uniref:NAD(P)-binding domain-containing protein n=1 Tax=Streptosporangium carneum TaxID=47481 RepID=A0A9W6MHG3_9ACTN|nr:hypothetical protein [Streptosporangium carneum]GLK14008.1 hypothetical protein GCM10017600_74200 [Streptosporangium carneum]
MTSRTWLITGVSGGFGRELTERPLERGDRVLGTVRDSGKVADLTGTYPRISSYGGRVAALMPEYEGNPPTPSRRCSTPTRAASTDFPPGH